MDRALVGFDIRFSEKDCIDVLWKGEWRDIILLRPDIEWPLSVSIRIWPSFFRDIRRDDGVVKVPPSLDRRDERTGLWSDMGKMKAMFMEKMAGSGKQGIVIAIEVVSKGLLSQLDDFRWLSRVSPPTPSQTPRNWPLLGYDVTYDSCCRTSVLSAMGHREGEKAEWGPMLNEFGLFHDFEDAWAYKEFKDEYPPEAAAVEIHYVYALYRDPEILTAI